MKEENKLTIEDNLSSDYYDVHNILLKQCSKLAKERSKFIDEQLQSFGITKDNAKEYHIDVQLHNNGTETFNIYKKEYKGGFTIEL